MVNTFMANAFVVTHVPMRLALRSRMMATKAARKADKKVAKAREMKVALREEEQRALLSGRLLPHEHMPTFTLVERVIASHRAACGKSLFKLNDAGRHAAKQLWEAPIACLVVGG